jgi:Flp pilus assembly pilin Flp
MNRVIETSLFAAPRLRLSFKRDAGVIEYGLLGALIALVIITGVTTAGTDLGTVFRSASFCA